MKKIKFFLLLFLFIFGPVFRPIGNWFDLIFLTSVGLVVLNVLFVKSEFPRQLKWVLPLFLVSFYITAIMGLQGFHYEVSDLFRVLMRPLRIVITFLGGFYLVSLGKKHWNLSHQDILFAIFLVFSAHAVIMIYQFLSPSFKDWIYSLTFVGEFRSSFDYNFRMGGLSGGSGGAILSSVQGIGLIIPMLAWKLVTKSRKVIFIVLTPIVFASILLSGRSGLFVAFLAAAFLIFLRSGNPVLFLRRALVIFILSVVVVTGIVLGFEYLEPQSDVYYAISRSLDTFLSLRQSGTLGDSGFSNYRTFFHFPNDLIVWLFGDPVHLVNDQYGREVESDIGFIRNLWSYGLIFSMLFWFPIFSLFVYAIKDRRESFRHLAVVVFIMVIIHVKESGLYVRMLWSIVTLFFGLSYLEGKNIKERYETSLSIS